MSWHGALAQVGRSSINPSTPELLFREYVAKRISKDEYEVGTCIHMADHLGDYRPRAYPTLSPMLVEYIRARATRVRETRDPALHQKVGAWTQTVRWVLDQNIEDVDTLIWALSKLQPKKLTKHVDAIKKKLVEFEIHAPPEHLEIAMKAQIMDSQAKARGGSA